MALFFPREGRVLDHILFTFTCQVSLFSFNLEKSLSLSLPFMTLTFLKNPGQLLNRMFLSLGLSDVSS